MASATTSVPMPSPGIRAKFSERAMAARVIVRLPWPSKAPLLQRDGPQTVIEVFDVLIVLVLGIQDQLLALVLVAAHRQAVINVMVGPALVLGVAAEDVAVTFRHLSGLGTPAGLDVGGNGLVSGRVLQSLDKVLRTQGAPVGDDLRSRS